jgi:hypothetical protein
MDTYAESMQDFQAGIEAASVFNTEQLAIGLCSSCGFNLTNAEIQQRFEAIQQLGVSEVDLWDTPIPDQWAPFLAAFLNQ